MKDQTIILLTSFYKALRQKGNLGPRNDRDPSDSITNVNFSVDLASAQVFLDVNEDALWEYAALIPELSRKGWLNPRPESRDNQGYFSTVTLTPLGINTAKEVLSNE